MPDTDSCSDAGSHTPESRLPDGKYRFELHATDTVGNTDSDSHDFTVDTGIKGSASATRNQKQPRQGTVVRIRVSAHERLRVRAKGTIRLGGRTARYRLAAQVSSIAAGNSRILILKLLRSHHQPNVARAFKQGMPARTSLTVKLRDRAGNERTRKLRVRLTRPSR